MGSLISATVDSYSYKQNPLLLRISCTDTNVSVRILEIIDKWFPSSAANFADSPLPQPTLTTPNTQHDMVICCSLSGHLVPGT